MKLEAVIADDYKGNPKIKVTQDAPEVTLIIYTEDINLLKSWVGRPLEIKVKEEK